ncbi:hypothetical protein SDC9_134867 [bioreactor metagenome]|uniref:Uncharacterized protein n=1 Tax=bioreactor metagenome TaxID=1076179 RepID=A0A645DES1_9ZZZZ
MADPHVTDRARVLGDGGLHRAVGIYDVGLGRNIALLDRLVGEDLARAAAVLAYVEVDLRVVASDRLPVGDLTGVDVDKLLERKLRHLVGWVHDHRDAVDREGERLKAVLLDLVLFQRAAGVADLHEPFADLLDADAGAAAGHGDADIGVDAHDALGRLFHDGDVRGAAGDVDLALPALKNVQRRGGESRRREEAYYRRDEKLLH